MITLKKISFLFFFAALFHFPLSSMAKPSTLEMLNNYSLFSDWIKKHASFECSSTPYLQSTMEEQIPKTLFLGLNAITSINPELMIEKIEANGKGKVHFTCIPEKSGRDWGALYDPTPFFIALDSFRFSTTGDMIVLPENIVRNLYVDPEDLVTASSEKSKASKEEWFYHAKFDRETYEKNAIVHEYLHYLGFDNFSAGAHNSVGNADSLIRFDDDLVYSCSELSFPTWTLQLKHGRHLDNGVYKDFNLGKACLMCAMAKVSKKNMRIDGSRGEKAVSICAPYRELRY